MLLLVAGALCGALLLLGSARPAFAVDTYKEGETAGVWTLTGSWSTSSNGGYHGGGAVSLSNGPGAASVAFTIPAGDTGTVTHLGYCDPTYSTGWEWSLDGGSYTTVEAPGGTFCEAFTITGIAEGSHTLTIRYPTEHVGDSRYLYVDALHVTSSSGGTTTTTTAPSTTTTAPSTTTTSWCSSSNNSTTSTSTCVQLIEGEVRPDNTTKQGLGVLVLLATAYFVFKVGRDG